MITVKGLNEVTVLLESTSRLFQKPEALLNDLLFFQKSQILTRTASGIDYERDPFFAYSPWYAEVRREAGRPTEVDLNFTGEMLSAITTKVDGNTGTLYFADQWSNEKAFQLQEEGIFRKSGKNVKRTFFAVSEFDTEGHDQIIEEHLDRAMNGS